MNIPEALARIVEGNNLSQDDARGFSANHVWRGDSADRCLLAALRVKGETAEEIAGAA